MNELEIATRIILITNADTWQVYLELLLQKLYFAIVKAVREAFSQQGAQ